MRINHNLASLNTYRQLSGNTAATSKSLEKLSSGLRINRAGDDAAGLAISEKMRGQIRGLDQASSNSQNAISLIQTAEGALSETHSILQRMRELAVQSATDTNTSGDRSKIQSEVDQLAKEITRISNTTEFNTQNLLAGGLNDTFHVGANAGQNVSLNINGMDAKTLGVASDVNVIGAFGAGTTTLASSAISNGDLGRGLTAQSYNLVVTHNAATGTEVNDGFAGTAVTAGTYTGDRNETNVLFKGTQVAANQFTAAEYSTDGGTTWSAASLAAGVITYKGATITITANAGNAVGQTYTASFTAQNDSIQLQTTTGPVNIGSAVTAYQDMNTVTVGDAASGRTMNINSTSLGALTSGTATQVVSSSASTTASIGANGEVTTAAVTQAGVDISTQATANTAITTINTALERVSTERSKLGAMQNRLEHTIANLGTSAENLTASESRVRDVDMAKEMMEFTKNNILSQAAQAMLAQANQQPQGVLQLLR